jgi:2-oxoglutarate dehydrogenase E1 component
VEEMFAQWSEDSQSVHASWDVYFRTGAYSAPPTLGVADYKGSGTNDHAAPRGGFSSGQDRNTSTLLRVMQLVRGFQVRGHFLANLDPLKLAPVSNYSKELDVGNYGFTEDELDTPVDFSSLKAMLHNVPTGFLSESGNLTIRQIHQRLMHIYCGPIGYEYMHIPDVDKCNWIREKIETIDKLEHTPEERKVILDRLTWADHFERALADKYTTAKRFGLEGAESFIPGMKALIDTSSALGVENVVIGMPHRGRLNVLSSVVRKPLEMILHEFDGTLREDEEENVSGDVKYHLGLSNVRDVNGKKMHLHLMANPSHLEAVAPVVVGKTRAKQFYDGDKNGERSMGLLLHGDAAMAGQGIVFETFGLGSLEGYSTGGTIHFVVNNQIGFTTDPHCSRSSPYCSDVAKAVNAPVFHVNGDDPEAVVKVCDLAAQYRAKFLSDVVIDMVCYRQHGHNEIDEPAFTQPLMYQNIRSKPSVLQSYTKFLTESGKLTLDDVQQSSSQVYAEISTSFEKAKTYVKPPSDTLQSDWSTMDSRSTFVEPQSTGVDSATLQQIGEKLCSLPEGFNIHPRLKGIFEKKQHSLQQGVGLDWSCGEALAFGSLLAQGTHVRLSGQDVERGTFSHRHSVLHDQKTGDKYTALNNLGVEGAAHFSVSNSNLSEFGVLGFELGYSMESPNALVIWEAQFGDFSNGAQIMIDQFISSQEDKWLRQSGLVMLLPHGYEGMGPEHSSARLERFLQLSDTDLDVFPERIPNFNPSQHTNWRVINPTTPANIFHALRRQVTDNFRKPLIVMSPKSLLRHPMPKSNLSDIAPGTFFQSVIHDTATLVAPEQVRKIVFCSGKVFYDLDAARTKQGINDVAIYRVEELNPFPFHVTADIISKHPNAEVMWCQEEPKNQGAYSFTETGLRTSAIHGAGRPESFDILYSGRKAMAATATGYAKVHNTEQAQLIARALS